MGLNTFGASTVSEPPIGTTVDTLLVGNDPSKSNWVKMNTNTFIDTQVYPSFSGITEGILTAISVGISNLPSLVTGNWKIKTSLYNGSYFLCVATDTITPTTYSRTFRSSDGLTWVEVGNLPNSTSYLQQSKLYYFNSKVYCVSTRGVHETTDNGVNWTQKTTTYYYSMGYNSGLFLLTDTIGKIYSTTDLITYTQRYTSANSTQPITGFIYSSTFSKFYSVVNTGGVSKVVYSPDGISAWTEVSINSGAHVYENIVQFNGVIYVFTGGAGAQTSGIVFKSTNGTTFADCTAEFNGNYATGAGAYSDQRLIGTTNLLLYPTVVNGALPMFRDLSGRVGRSVNNEIGAGSLHTMSTYGGYIYCLVISESTSQITVSKIPDIDFSTKVVSPVASKMLRVF